MGIKDLKNRKHRTITISNELDEFIIEYSKKTGIPQSRIVDKALEILKERIEKGENIFV